MKLTKEEASLVICGDHLLWKTIENKIYDRSRWSIHKSGIFEYLPSGKFYRLQWSQGATESQEEQPFQHEDPNLIEVYPVEKTVIVYEQVT